MEIVLDIGICSGNFEALSKKYSLLHNRRLPTDVAERKIEAKSTTTALTQPFLKLGT